MKKFYTSLAAIALTSTVAFGQIQFDPTIDTSYTPDVITMSPSPLQTQVLFIGGVDMVQTTATYGNPAGAYPAKQWHDFIGFTPDPSSSDLGWLSVNHEMVLADDNIGDGGGMTVFKIAREATTDSIVIVPQTLGDGRSGEFFNVDFANTVGETGMNCGGIISKVDGRIWTAEEWFRGNTASIYDGGNGVRDTATFTIGTDGNASGITVADGQTIDKYQNFNWMVEIDPREAVAIRKQYNWGRQPFEGGVVMTDNRTVYTGGDATPGYFSKFVATTPGDFTSGNLYVYKHDNAGGNPWVQVDNSNFNNMLKFDSVAVALSATMFNRIEWVTADNSGKVYFTETGRDNPGGRWAGELADGAVLAPHHIARATAQGTTADDAAYEDFYGRVMMYDPATNNMSVKIEGGPDLPQTGNPPSAYPSTHLSNPDGLSAWEVNGREYLIIQEDLNGSDYGRVPDGTGNRTCEIFLLDLTIPNPTPDDLLRIAVVPLGAEVTGGVGSPDGKTLFFNSQHPSSSNPYPYNNSVTIAITGFDKSTVGVTENFNDDDTFQVFPNPVSRELRMNKVSDVAIYNSNGQRVLVARQVKRVDVSHLDAGLYIIMDETGNKKKLIIE